MAKWDRLILSPNVGVYLFRRECREQNFSSLAEARRRLRFPQLAGKYAHSRVHQMPTTAHGTEHRKSVLVIPGFLQNNTIELRAGQEKSAEGIPAKCRYGPQKKRR